MALTRPKFAQIDSALVIIRDPITGLNSESTLANIDVGFVFNRDGGVSANATIFWDETNSEFAMALTTDSGTANSNISVSSYADLKVGTITSVGNVTGGNLVTAGTISVDGAISVNSGGGGFTLPILDGSNGQSLTTYGNGVVYWTSTGGGGGTPGGLDTYVQFNDGATFGGDAGFTYNKTTDTLTVTGNVTGGNLLPPTDNTGVVGSTDFTWKNGRFTDLTIDDVLTVRTAIDLADGDILRFGDNDDWELFHDGTANRIDLNTRDLTIRDNITTRFTFGRTTGDFTATGNITTANISTTDVLASNITTANISTTDILANSITTANISTANILTVDLLADNITTGDILASNVVPSANITYDLGSPSMWWRDLYLSGGTLHLGNILLKDTGGTLSIFDGSGNTVSSGDRIASGTSNVRIVTTDANVSVAVNGGVKAEFGDLVTELKSPTYITDSTDSTNAVTGALVVTGGASVGANLHVGTNLHVFGNLEVNGTQTIFNTNNASFNDGMIYLADGNSGNSLDLGFVAAWTSDKYQHGGLVRDANDSIWKLFGNVVSEPTTVIDFTNAEYQTLKTGNILAQDITASSFKGSGTLLDLSGFTGPISEVNSSGAITAGDAVTFDFSDAEDDLTITNTTVEANVFTRFGTTEASKWSWRTNWYWSGTALTKDEESVGSWIVEHKVMPNDEDNKLTIDYSPVNTNNLANILIMYGNTRITAPGDIYANAFIGDGSQLTGLPEGYSNVQTQAYLTTNSYATEAYVTQANVGMKGYVDFGNTIQAGSITQANVGMKGYVDNEIANIPPGYSNVQVATYLPVYGGIIEVSEITHAGTNGTGNIGASGDSFNTVFAKATSAQYADLAEKYIADKDYAPGTVVVFGGGYEITESTESHQRSIAGVISTQPAYLMNSDEDGLPVALQGRVPCNVLGPIRKGDLVVASDIPGVAEKLNDARYLPGCVIGKALNSIETNEIASIEVVVGRV